MDPHQQEQQRHPVQWMFRQVLQGRGFVYCDEGVGEDAEPLPGGLAAAPLLAEGVAAGSTDHPTQSIKRTLEPNPRSFWSSRGAATPDEGDFLLYRLSSPLCLVQYVQLLVFRALYQFGEPIYPPQSVSFQVGPSPACLGPPTPQFPVRPSNRVQTFLLPAWLPAGRFLRVNLHGRQQRQLEDMQYYLAIQQVEAFGVQLPPSDLALLRCWSRGARPALDAGGSLPSHLVASGLRSLQQGGVAGQQQEEQQGGQQQQQQQQQPGKEGYSGEGAAGSSGEGGLLEVEEEDTDE